MNARDTMALLGYAAMLDDTVDLRDDSNGMNGGDPVRDLLNEIQHIEAEIVRLKIAHLRRMAKASAEIVGNWPSVLASIPPDHADVNSWRARWIRKHMALQSACLAKIAELKESQCSTKS